MTDSAMAVSARGISKAYRILHADTRNSSLAEAVARRIRHPVQRAAVETFWALRNVSFDIKEGDAVGIIGRNGAGKSTLLKILSRITEPTEGEIHLNGRVGSLLEVGTGFHPELTGRENVYLNGTILGMSRREIDGHFDAIVEFSGVEKFLDTPVKRYSSGMYVRLAFAVAAHLEPEILIVDEVLAVGDSAFQKKCLGKMKDAAQEGRTILFVSHNMAAVSQLCKTAIWIDGGQVRTVGAPAEVIGAYLSETNVQASEHTWHYPGDAPGDETVRLLNCRVVQAGEVTGIIDINEPFEVELVFRVLEPCRNLISGVSFYSNEGVCLFNNCDWRPNELAPGTYVKQVRLPAPLFAEGGHTVLVQLVFYDPDVKSVVLPNILSFDAVDSDHANSVRGHYKGPWQGAVRIGLPWTSAHEI